MIFRARSGCSRGDASPVAPPRGTTVRSVSCQARWPSGGDESVVCTAGGFAISRRSVDGLTMAEYIDIGKLPEDVREKLAELDLELSEGE